MKAQITHRTKTQNHSLIVVSAFALTMTALLVTDMVRNNMTRHASYASAIEMVSPAHLTSLPVATIMLPTVDVVATKVPVSIANETLPVQDWMMETETWLDGQLDEPTLKLQDWMFANPTPADVCEETPDLQSWMFTLDGWISASLAVEQSEIQSWMYDTSNWL